MIKGQSLLELVMALGLITVIITILTVTNINGLKSNELSQSQTIATKLAQQGIDFIRNIRDQSGTVCNMPGNSSNSFSGIWSLTSCPSPAGCTFKLNTTAGSCAALSTSPNWLNYQSAPEAISQNGVNFLRQVTLIDRQANEKEVKVTVTWTDTSGTHNSTLNTILTAK